MKKLDVINFLRGFSIFTIVLMHLVQSYDIPSWLMKATSFGGAGVHVFILCSGFGLYLSYLHKPLGYKDFIKKRFGRIYFPMAVVCLFTAVWMAYQGKDVLMPLLGNLLLFKMFVPELESSMGGQMWFISTIIQFYVAWPLIVKLMNVKRGLLYVLLISLMWSTLVGLLGFGEERVWNSFFLQYLWEFCLGMKLAEVYLKRPAALNAPQWKILIPVCIVAMMMTGVLGWLGFPWKLYNDIPSLVGYTSFALILYKLGISQINNLFVFTNKFSYEWYLVHILVFQIVMLLLNDSVPNAVEFIICLLLSYFVAWGYGFFWTKKKSNVKAEK